MGKTVSLMLDTKGPEMRLGDFAEGKVYLKKGNKFTLTNDDIPGDETHVSINHKKLYTEVKPGNTLLLSDGLVGLHVDEIVGKDIVCTILNDGPMSTRKRAAAPVYPSVFLLFLNKIETISFSVLNMIWIS